MSRLAQLSLGRRALTALITAAIAILGVVSLGSLRQELIPSVSLPVAAVVGVYPGASPEIVETQVTAPLEQAALGIGGVEGVSSTASSNVSITTIEFRYGINVTDAVSQLRGAIDAISGQLPEDVDPQVVAGSIDDLPVLQLAVSGGDDSAALQQGVADILQPALEDIPGVRGVSVTGAPERQVRFDVDPVVLAANGLTPEAVLGVLEDNGVSIPTGTVTDGDQTLSVQVGTPITDLAALEALPLTTAEGATVPLGQVVTVTDGEAPATSYSRVDGEDSLAVAVTKTPEANVVEVSEAVQAELDALADRLDAQQISATVVFDQAPFITESIEGLATEGGLGLVFAVVVILLFLVSWRSTAVSAVSIPLSLLVAFSVMNATGYTLNILTLAALTISIGRVVDDSIVVIENITRHLSYGEERTAAVIGAVKEVGGAITSSTLATIAVFLPIGFVSGFVGEIFRPFAFTVAIAMLASLFVALTIIPVLAYWFLKSPVAVDGDEEAAAEAQRVVREKAEAKERRGIWQRGYLPLLAASLHRPFVALGVAFAVLAGTLALVPQLETNLIGDSGQDTVTVTADYTPGTSLEAQDAAARGIETELIGLDGIESVQTSVGSGDGAAAFFGGGSAGSATFALTLAHDGDGVAITDEVRSVVADLVAEPVRDIEVSAGAAGFGTSSTVDLVVTADDPAVLAEAADIVLAAAREVPGTSAVSTSAAADQPVIQVSVDRDAAAAVGLSETAVATTVAGVMATPEVGQVQLDDARVTVVASFGDGPASVEELQALPLLTAAGPVPLAQVATVKVVETPAAITRVDGRRTVTIALTPAGQDVGALTGDVNAAIADLELPAGADVDVAGLATDQAEAFEDLGLALVLAVAIVYIVLVATFNSLGQPLILLVSVPFAVTGSLVALLITGTPLWVPALIGFLMLVGVVVSNAIVLIDLINQYRTGGRSIADAVTEGARKRLRPIVMTAAATIFALLPMAFGITGGGAFISQPLAVVVIGGLISSTALTLVVVPVLYVLVERGKERRAAKRAAKRGEGAVPEPAAAEEAESAEEPTEPRGRHAAP